MVDVYNPFVDSDGTIRWWNATDGTARDIFVNTTGNALLSVGGTNTTHPFIDSDEYLKYSTLPSANVWAMLRNGKNIRLAGDSSTTWDPTNIEWTKTITFDTGRRLVVRTWNGNLHTILSANSLYAYYADGTINWEVASAGRFVTADDNYVYTEPSTNLNKYDNLGNFEWSKNITYAGRGVQVDNSGNIYTLRVAIPKPNTYDVYLDKRDADGVIIWTEMLLDTSASLWHLTVDSAGNVYRGGGNLAIHKWDTDQNLIYSSSGITFPIYWMIPTSSGTVYYAGGYGTGTSNNVGKLDTSGNMVWEQQTGSGYCYGIDIDSNENVYVVGETASGKNLWVYNSSGVLQWTWSGGGTLTSVAVA